MLSILCPHCQTKLTVEEQWRGKIINCLNCGQKMAIAATATAAPVASPATDESKDSLTISTQDAPSSSNKKRQRSLVTQVLNIGMHLSITAATIYAAYYFLVLKREPAAPPQAKVIEQPKTPSINRPAKVPRQMASSPAQETHSPDTWQTPSLPIEPNEPDTSPFEHVPTQIALPSEGDLSAIELATVPAEYELQLISNSDELELRDQTLWWRDAANGNLISLAKLETQGGVLQFCWLAQIPKDVEVVVRNSALRLNSRGHQHVLSLRTAQQAEHLQLDLNEKMQRVVCRCDWAPKVEDICFEFLGVEQLPACTTEGPDIACLKVRDQTILNYTDSTGAATRLTMKKRGNLVAVEFEHGYALPSGEELPMLITQGNKKLQQLESLFQETTSAEQALPGLRSRLQAFQREAATVARSQATNVTKASRLAKLQQNITATQQNVHYAERLIAQKMSITADRQAIRDIATLAQQLHETKVAYRFYTVIDGHEIDLLVAR